MSKSLDEFLGRLECELRELPETTRENDIAEVRGHLELLVAQGESDGLLREKAIERALRNFGSPRKLGGELRRAHQKPESWWRLVLALTLCCGLSNLNTQPGGLTQGDFWFLSFPLTLLHFGVMGAILGVIAPRRAHGFFLLACAGAALWAWPFSQWMLESLRSTPTAQFDNQRASLIFFVTTLLGFALFAFCVYCGILSGNRLSRRWQTRRN